MNRIVTSRIATLMTAAVVVVIAACSDANGSLPNLTGPNASTSTGGPKGDSAKNTPGNPGGGHPDTGSTSAPKPVATFTLAVFVGSARPGIDTVATDPIAGAGVSVYDQSVTFTNHPGADSANITQTLVASGTSDANGNFSAPNLKGSGTYVVKVAPPAGTNFAPASTFIGSGFSDVMHVSITLPGQ